MPLFLCCPKSTVGFSISIRYLLSDHFCRATLWSPYTIAFQCGVIVLEWGIWPQVTADSVEAFRCLGHRSDVIQGWQSGRKSLCLHMDTTWKTCGIEKKCPHRQRLIPGDSGWMWSYFYKNIGRVTWLRCSRICWHFILHHECSCIFNQHTDATLLAATHTHWQNVVFQFALVD